MGYVSYHDTPSSTMEEELAGLTLESFNEDESASQNRISPTYNYTTCVAERLHQTVFFLQNITSHVRH